MTTIPDHVGREACKLLNEDLTSAFTRYAWTVNKANPAVITVAKLLMNPPAPMTDPDEEAAKRVMEAASPRDNWSLTAICRATEQMRKEREAWEAGR